MPTINIEPKAMQNGDNVTTYKDTVGPQQQTYTFLTSQERVILKNSGSKNITYTVGSQSGTLGPSQMVDVKETISSINLTAEQGTQQFEIWADESGTKGTSPEAVQSLGDQVSGFASSLAESAKHKSNWLNVVENGVKNDGTDCTTNLSSLMSANAGAVFFFPKGDYLLSSSLPYLTNSTALVGETGTRIITSQSYVSDGLNCLFRVPQYNNSSASIVSNIVVKGIEFRSEFKSTTLEGPYFVGLWGTDQFIIEDCKFICPYTQYSGDSVDIRGGCSNGTVRNNYFENRGEINSSPATGGSIMVRNYHATRDNYDIVITNNTFFKVGVDEAIWVAISPSAVNQDILVRDLIITNNRFICEAGTTGVSTTANPDCFITIGTNNNNGKINIKNILFANNEIRCVKVNHTVIRSYGENINILNNSIVYTNGYGVDDRIIEVVTGSVGKVNIKGNTIIASGSKYGITGDAVIQDNSIYFTGTSTSSVIFGSSSVVATVLNNYINVNTAVDVCENVLRVVDNTIIANSVTNIVQNVRDLIGNRITCTTNPNYLYANFLTTIDQIVIKRNVVRGVTGLTGIRCNTNALQRISVSDNEMDYGYFAIASMTLAVVINNILYNSTMNSGNVTTQITATTLQFKNNLVGSSYLSI